MDVFWDELIFNTCGGNAAEMAALRKFDIIDFFSYIENKNRKNA